MSRLRAAGIVYCAIGILNLVTSVPAVFLAMRNNPLQASSAIGSVPASTAMLMSVAVGVVFGAVSLIAGLGLSCMRGWGRASAEAAAWILGAFAIVFLSWLGHFLVSRLASIPGPVGLIARIIIIGSMAASVVIIEVPLFFLIRWLRSSPVRQEFAGR